MKTPDIAGPFQLDGGLFWPLFGFDWRAIIWKRWTQGAALQIGALRIDFPGPRSGFHKGLAE